MDQPAKRPKWYTPLNEKLIEVCRGRFAIDETKTKLLHSYSVILDGRETRLGSRKYVRPAYGRTYLETGIFLGKKYDCEQTVERHALRRRGHRAAGR